MWRNANVTIGGQQSDGLVHPSNKIIEPIDRIPEPRLTRLQRHLSGAPQPSNTDNLIAGTGRRPCALICTPIAIHNGGMHPHRPQHHRSASGTHHPLWRMCMARAWAPTRCHAEHGNATVMVCGDLPRTALWRAPHAASPAPHAHRAPCAGGGRNRDTTTDSEIEARRVERRTGGPVRR